MGAFYFDEHNSTPASAHTEQMGSRIVLIVGMFPRIMDELTACVWVCVGARAFF